ncbi:MAG: type II toxin-antitoxin system VapC family toxin [Chitinophagaceae bacterium]
MRRICVRSYKTSEAIVKTVMIDTSILIEFYRKTDKANSAWFKLVGQQYDFVISSITKYEIYSGATENQLKFWNDVLKKIKVIPFDENSVDAAISINKKLKLKRKQISHADLFIAATAVAHNLPFVTLNKKHFERVEALKMIE